MSKLINRESLKRSLLKTKSYIDNKLETIRGVIQTILDNTPDESLSLESSNAVSNKTVTEEINKINTTIETNNTSITERLNVIQGEDEGSIKKEVSKGIASIVDSAPDTLDTLKEVADWIKQDETHSAELIELVNKKLDKEDALFEKGQSDNSATLKNGENEVVGVGSFAVGEHNKTSKDYESAFGKYNKTDSNTIFSVGCGTSEDSRKNAITVDNDGNVYVRTSKGWIGNINEFNKSVLYAGHPSEEEEITTSPMLKNMGVIYHLPEGMSSTYETFTEIPIWLINRYISVSRVPLVICRPYFNYEGEHLKPLQTIAYAYDNGTDFIVEWEDYKYNFKAYFKAIGDIYILDKPVMTLKNPNCNAKENEVGYIRNKTHYVEGFFLDDVLVSEISNFTFGEEYNLVYSCDITDSTETIIFKKDSSDLYCDYAVPNIEYNIWLNNGPMAKAILKEEDGKYNLYLQIITYGSNTRITLGYGKYKSLNSLYLRDTKIHFDNIKDNLINKTLLGELHWGNTECSIPQDNAMLLYNNKWYFLERGKEIQINSGPPVYVSYLDVIRLTGAPSYISKEYSVKVYNVTQNLSLGFIDERVRSLLRCLSDGDYNYTTIEYLKSPVNIIFNKAIPEDLYNADTDYFNLFDIQKDRVYPYALYEGRQLIRSDNSVGVYLTTGDIAKVTVYNGIVGDLSDSF